MTQNVRRKLQNRATYQTNLAPLICRVVRAVRVRGRWAWIPGWGLPLRSRLSPPTCDSKSLKFIKFYKHFEINGFSTGVCRRLGVLTGAERMPPPGIQAQRPRTRTARTTRQINGAIIVGF